MKKIFIIFFFLLTIIPAITAIGDGASYTFTVYNNTSESIGNVTINLSNNTSDTLNVDSSGAFATQVSGSAISVVVYEHTVTYPTTGIFTLPNGPHIRIRWQSEVIVIIDQNEL